MTAHAVGANAATAGFDRIEPHAIPSTADGKSAKIPQPSAALTNQPNTAPAAPRTRVPIPPGAGTELPAAPTLALTINDGTDPAVVAAYIQFAKDNGARFTFFVTASYHSWTLSDSSIVTEDYLIECVRKYLTPGAVVIGHAIHPAVTHVHPKLLDNIRTRELTLVTLNDVYSPIR
ncbi:hypothetical protein [Rhodococcus sp. BP22]|uniref:hypothetical protein n=1 Tax=Rhodococcus sp. BP22 TaxID=2758566 RepID=UPI0016455AD0|nr:hypothetical protein [Rhodococcus sp. BP22]